MQTTVQTERWGVLISLNESTVSDADSVIDLARSIGIKINRIDPPNIEGVFFGDIEDIIDLSRKIKQHITGAKYLVAYRDSMFIVFNDLSKKVEY